MIKGYLNHATLSVCINEWLGFKEDIVRMYGLPDDVNLFEYCLNCYSDEAISEIEGGWNLWNLIQKFEVDEDVFNPDFGFVQKLQHRGLEVLYFPGKGEFSCNNTQVNFFNAFCFTDSQGQQHYITAGLIHILESLWLRGSSSASTFYFFFWWK